MGVRFECPAGHKLHVKAHLAGQRGICPECGVRFIVPTFSGGRVAEAPGSGSFDPAASGSGSGYVSVALESSASFAAGLSQGAAAGSNAAEWYVRPSSGGQFGPVDTIAFQQWVQEGRVGPDAWVWRTGWPDWKAGGDAVKAFAAEQARQSSPAAAPRPPLPPTPRPPARSFATPLPSTVAARQTPATSAPPTPRPAAARTPAPPAPALTPGLATSVTPSFESEIDFDDFLGPSKNGAAEVLIPSTLPNPREQQARRRKANQRLTLILAFLAIVLLVVAIVVLNRPARVVDDAPTTGPAIESPASTEAAEPAASGATGDAPKGDAPTGDAAPADSAPDA